VDRAKLDSFRYQEVKSANDFGFVRVASLSPELRVGDVAFNAERIKQAMHQASDAGASYVLFPELALTGYSCGDLFFQALLQSAAIDALLELATLTRELKVVAVVGLPIVAEGRLYNCAAVLSGGNVIGLVPKQYLPNSGEFYERRWFTAAPSSLDISVSLLGNQVPLSSSLLFRADDHSLTFGVEICEDLWTTLPPSGFQALAGAQLIFNPSASNELLGKAAYRRDLVCQQSARCLAAYAYSSAGPGESSTDVVFSGHCLISENGSLLAESERFSFETQIVMADVDIERLNHDRLCNSSFAASAAIQTFKVIEFNTPHDEHLAVSGLGSLRPNPPRPFVPADINIRTTTCEEIFSIQAAGLAKRIRHTGVKQVVIGISGGLDSTLALLVIVHAFDRLGLDRNGIIAPTMPGFGTSNRTRSNAEKLVALLGARLSVIPIADAVNQHFNDIGHDPSSHDVTYENAQARERTQILMDLANKHGALVVGTGDLSESALGWCTFNGDHMSMYHVNVGVPKTLVRYLVEWCADHLFSGTEADVLRDICATPISPELLPLAADGSLQQQTEDVVGPYDLHDYFLYHMVRLGSRPAKILYMAEMAFKGQFSREEILKWLEVFIRRFFSQQFKRSSMPDGPKVGSVALSPRGDWRMPSDASAEVWLAEIRDLCG
jgi:NAD+ synthase (glutamine-hydrolysing)